MKNVEFLNEQVILVNEEDAEIGLMPKMEAHEKGLLHRAFSIFLFNSRGELLLQQRAPSKYHSPGLWSNTCCSHPRAGESTAAAAARRLREEMGMSCDLKHVFNFSYRAELGNNLIEHEYDHVFFGVTDSRPEINQKEVQSWKYISVDSLQADINKSPENYTAWLKIVLERVIAFRNGG